MFACEPDVQSAPAREVPASRKSSQSTPARGTNDERRQTAPTGVLHSDILDSMLSEIQPVLERTNSVASGARRWSTDSNHIAGAGLSWVSYALAGPHCTAELENMVRAASAILPRYAPFEYRAERFDAPDAARVASAMKAWVPENADHQRALDVAADHIANTIAQHPQIRVFSARAESAVARMVGVTLLDPQNCEAVWLFGQAVKMSTR
jgi:hypothetical protein